ncbi:hypothetical protein LOAG_16649 [Loa loa]|uniref:Uncharacterized protein n=1 Tax=Loa loa TaxID=7209 RepID=A0A1S0ULF1_LOALO|nr:hypothetical protein LOAG_16649 [Loa loa]EJD76415.1 hypothetical protein LOAG_16649 [Loa loa]
MASRNSALGQLNNKICQQPTNIYLAKNSNMRAELHVWKYQLLKLNIALTSPY